MKKYINLSVIILALFITFLAFFAPLLMPQDPNEIDLIQKFAPISKEHFLGTDHLGRDVFSRLLFGTSVSLNSAFITIVLILILGIGIGGISGFIGGKFDGFVMRICDLFISFPTVIFAFFLVGILGIGLVNVIIAIALTHFAWYARIVRSIVLNLKNKEYILISKISGASVFENFRKNMLLPILSRILILATLDIGHIILHISGLSFLGLGVKAPTPEWGIMINDAKDYIFTHYELVIYPGLAILFTVCIFNMLGDILRDKFDTSLEFEHYENS